MAHPSLDLRENVHRAASPGVNGETVSTGWAWRSIGSRAGAADVLVREVRRRGRGSLTKSPVGVLRQEDRVELTSLIDRALPGPGSALDRASQTVQAALADAGPVGPEALDDARLAARVLTAALPGPRGGVHTCRQQCHVLPVHSCIPSVPCAALLGSRWPTGGARVQWRTADADEGGDHEAGGDGRAEVRRGWCRKRSRRPWSGQRCGGGVGR